MATLVAFHAHPDDEVLLTGGTLAKAVAEGHRVVIVVATDTMVAADEGQPQRMIELRASARVLGVHRVEHLGYADSGHGPVLYPDPPDRRRFARADVEEAAGRLARLLREENADLLLSYDANGGYGHRDHRKVHVVGKRAAEMAGVRVLEATLPRDLALRMIRLIRLLRVPFGFDPRVLESAFSPADAITHRISVRKYAAQKQSALAMHRSQVYGGGRVASVMRLLVRMPSGLFGLLLGYEWFVEENATPAR